MSCGDSLTHVSALPFSFDSLALPDLEVKADNELSGPDDSNNLLPATHRRTKYKIVAFTEDTPDLLSYLEQELLVTRLNDIHGWLWVAGLPMPPRALHQQLVLNRSLVITEDPALHLVWSKNRIFIKPLPRFLLDPAFWAKHLVCPPHSETTRQGDLSGPSDFSPSDRPTSECPTSNFCKRANLVASACGFLFSYAALVAHESDYHIAVESRLLPPEVTWTSWKSFTKELLDKHSYQAVCPRYQYGELRIGRLNKVYRFRKGAFLSGYSSVSGYSFYTEFFEDNFGKLAAVLGYVVIVLTAMQVGLGTERLAANKPFQDVSFGFTVFSIIAPLAIIALILVVFLFLFIGHWMATNRRHRERLKAMV